MQAQIDLSAYDISVKVGVDGGVVASVSDLPGCIAVGADVAELQTALIQAIYIYLDQHPDAPARYK